ncbi:MAG: hypothetical protein M1281_15345 [Chloroflexi bacterium]|nr:hypothetical protein [Chloroflexota bacterium]
MGVCFIVNFVAALVAVLGIAYGKSWGWFLGLFIAAGSIGGYVISRTVGLPGLEVEGWMNGQGMLSLVVEGAFILLAGIVLRRARATGKGFTLPAAFAKQDIQTDESIENKGGIVRFGTILPALAAMALIVAGIFTLPGHPHHDELLTAQVVSANSQEDESIAIQTTPVHDHQEETPTGKTILINRETLAEEFGLRVTLLGMTAMDGVIDLRFRILDSNKAATLIMDHNYMPYLLIGTEHSEVVYPTRMGHHGQTVRDGDIYFLLFPNPQRNVQAGMPVSIGFGDLVLEPILIQ